MRLFVSYVVNDGKSLDFRNIVMGDAENDGRVLYTIEDIRTLEERLRSELAEKYGISADSKVTI